MIFKKGAVLSIEDKNGGTKKLKMKKKILKVRKTNMKQIKTKILE